MLKHTATIWASLACITPITTAAAHDSSTRPWLNDHWKPSTDFFTTFTPDASFEEDWRLCRHDPVKLQNPSYTRWCQLKEAPASHPDGPLPWGVGPAELGLTLRGKVCKIESLDRKLIRDLAMMSSAVYAGDPLSSFHWLNTWKLIGTYTTGTDFALIALTPKREIIVSFRGSDGMNDLPSNVQIRKKALISGVGQTGSIIFPSIHGGFMDGYNKMRIMTECKFWWWGCTYNHTDFMTMLLETIAENPGSSVLFTGHSRGGAMASIGALHLMYDTSLNSFSGNADAHLNLLRKNKNIFAYTFGEPRQLSFRGNLDLNTTLLDAIKKYRFTYYGDPVTGLPVTGVTCSDVQCDTWRHWGVAHRIWQDDPSTTEDQSWGGDQYGLEVNLESRCLNSNFPDTYADWSSQVWRHDMVQSYVQSFNHGNFSSLSPEELPSGWAVQACLHSSPTCHPATQMGGTCLVLAKGETVLPALQCLVFPRTSNSFIVQPGNSTAGIIRIGQTLDSGCFEGGDNVKRDTYVFACTGPFTVTLMGNVSNAYIHPRPTYPGIAYPAKY